MATLSLAIRRGSPRRLFAIVLVASQTVAAANYFLFSDDQSWVWNVHKATHGWINANLTIFLPMSAVIIGAMVMAWDRQSLRDLGLSGRWIMRLLAYLLAGWGLVQLMALVTALMSGTPVALHPAWSQHGAGTLMGLLIAMVLGTALFEDGLFRGYVLPQINFLLEGRIAGEAARMITALLVCATIFALWHLPTILLNREVTAGAVAGALAYMFLGGVMLGLLYLRTGRLEIVIALHALVNAPTLLLSSPVPGSLLAGIVGVVAIAAGPGLAGADWSTGLIRFKAANGD